MAQKVLIMGESGTGKSTSMRNLDPSTLSIVNPVGKALPFKGKFDTLDGETSSSKIIKWVKEQVKAGKKQIVIDDFQYILSVPYMNRIKENGWDKWNDFGANYFELIDMCEQLPDDVIVYYMTHTETLENGVTTIKLIGKLLREKITIEGLYTIVLRTGVDTGSYYFYTQNSGRDTVKSPIGMFPAYAIKNDLAYVDDKIRSYYEIGSDFKTDEEMKQADADVSSPIQKPDENGRRRRGLAATAEQSEEQQTAQRTRRGRTQVTEETVQPQEPPINTPADEQSKPRTRRSRNQQSADAANASAVEQAETLKNDTRDEVPFDEEDGENSYVEQQSQEQSEQPSTGRRTRRTRGQTAQEEQTAVPDGVECEQPLEEQPVRTRRTRRTRA